MQLKVDASDLMKWARYFESIPRATKPAIARALNTFGEGVTNEVVRIVSDKNGWDPDAVRQRIVVGQADPQHLEWNMDASLLTPTNDNWQRPWEQRDSSTFDQDTLVNIVTSEDASVCPVCEAAAEASPYTMAQLTDMQSRWADYVPPTPNIAPGVITNLIHPRAVLAGSSFASYGLVREMVSAIFDGPAVSLATDVGVVTIGPNHPMLTRRGFVSANKLTESDQLLYDVRCKRAGTATSYSDFKQMMAVENVFSSLRLLGDYSHIFASSHDFHGDRIFCQDKVDIVWPARQLLCVLDPSGIEHFSEDFFMGSDVKLPVELSLGIMTTFLERIAAQFTSLMCSRYLTPTLASCHALPFDSFLFGSGAQCNPVLAQDTVNRRPINAVPSRNSINTFTRFVETSNFFRWKPITRISVGHFFGPAFDATTEYGLYNSGGFVVKNCRCVAQPWTSYRRLPVSGFAPEGAGGNIAGDSPMQTAVSMRQLAKAVTDEIEGELKHLKVTVA